jgi:hypothetical protein
VKTGVQPEFMLSDGIFNSKPSVIHYTDLRIQIQVRLKEIPILCKESPKKRERRGPMTRDFSGCDL